jgi:hypothetical protein
MLEGAVIVASILLAFAIDAWWDGQQDRARERDYLALLASDLRSTLANDQRFASTADTVLDPAMARLVRAYYEPTLPPADSVLAWLYDAIQVLVVQPRLGTAETLVSSGDLALIRSDSLRTAIRDYITDMTFFVGSQRRGADSFQAERRELSEVISLGQVRLAATPRATRDSSALASPLFEFPAGEIRELTPLDVRDVVRNPGVHAILIRMLEAKRLNGFWRDQMRQRSKRLLQLVEAELAGGAL